MIIKDIFLKTLADNDIDAPAGSKPADLYRIIKEAGLAGDVISKAERYSRLPFKEIDADNADFSLIAYIGIDFFRENTCFPFMEKGVRYIAVSDSTSVRAMDDMLSDYEYVPCFCFDFFIKECLNAIENHSRNHSAQEIVEITDERKTLLLATNQPYIDDVISEAPFFNSKYSVLGKVSLRANLVDNCMSSLPEILLVSDALSGKQSMMLLLLEVMKCSPTTRIIYFVGNIDITDVARKNDIATLAAMGVYDIIEGDKLTASALQNILENPRTKDDVARYIKLAEAVHSSESKEEIKVSISETSEAEDVAMCPNVYTFISPKGSVGKTTLLNNVAMAIGKYGAATRKGKKPTVLIIDLDLQFFQGSYLLNTLDKTHNLFTALEAAGCIVDSQTEIDDIEKAQKNEDIMNSVVQSRKMKNVFVLGGPGTVYEANQRRLLTPNTLTYLIEMFSSFYDVVLVDANTDIECKSTFVLYELSRCVYNVFDFSIQSINASSRYFAFLKSQRLYHESNNKVIINKVFKTDASCMDERQFDNSLAIKGNVYIPKYSSEKAYSLDSHFAFAFTENGSDLAYFKAGILEIANDIVEIADYEKVVDSLGICNGEDTGKKKLFSFWK